MKSSVRELVSTAKRDAKSFKSDPDAIMSCTVPLRSAGSAKLYYCDTLDYLRSLPDSSVDAIVDDAPYGGDMAGKHGMMYRTQPIWCWRLPDKQFDPCVHFDWLDDSTEGKNWWNHPGTKPVSIMEKLLRAFVPRGGTVLDRYCGSGTTLVAAEILGMSAIGVDRDQYSLWVAHERIIDVSKQQKLFKTDTNQLSFSGDK